MATRPLVTGPQHTAQTTRISPLNVLSSVAGAQIMVSCSYELLAGYRWCNVIQLHYTSMPKQYEAIIEGCKNVNFELKKKNDIFSCLAHNIDCV